jgi:mono/diheme cytochrome c family protein
VWPKALLLAGVLAWGSRAGVGPSPAAKSKAAGVPAKGPADEPARQTAVLYRRLCVTCHGEDGSGRRKSVNGVAMPGFTDPAWQERRSDGRLADAILNGLGSAMPAFDDRLDGRQARDLVALIRTFNPKGIRPAAAGASADDFSLRMDALQKQFEALRMEAGKLLGNKPKE